MISSLLNFDTFTVLHVKHYNHIAFKHSQTGVNRIINCKEIVILIYDEAMRPQFKYIYRNSFLILIPFLSAFTRTRLLPIRSKAVTIAVVPSSVQDGLSVFGELTKDIGNLGAVVPLALGIFLIGRIDNKYDGLNKETRESFLKDIKETRESFLKDIKCTSEMLSKDIKCTSEILSKEIKSTNDAISRLEKIVEKIAQK